jgi:hypothetical protein
MKRHSEPILSRLSRWLLSALGVGLAVSPANAVGAEETPAEPKAEETPVLSPEEFFEGGSQPYKNWIELAVGGWFPSGNPAQFQQGQRTGNDLFGGLEDFHYQRDLGKDTLFNMDGRALFDNEDYQLKFDVAKADLGYFKFDFEQYRTWYNGDGGYYAPTDVWYPLGDEALGLDRGELKFETGLTLENIPKLVLRYTHRYREGDKSSTKWGIVSPDAGNPGGVRRYLTPSFYSIDEQVDIFELEATHRIKATQLGAGGRYEMGDLDNTFHSTGYTPLDVAQPTTDNEGSSYDLLNVHAFSETWIQKNLFFSTGFLFTDLDSDYSGSRNSAATPGLNYTDLNGGARQQEYTLNLNLLARPWTHFSVVPSVRVQKADWNADSGLPAAPVGQSDGDALDVSEELELRYTGVTNWVFYARGEWTQGDGELNEAGGIGLTPVIQRETEDSRNFQKYVAGITWYPVRRVSLDTQYYYKIHDYDYDHTFDSTLNSSGNRYPAYLVMQGFETQDANVRLTWRPHNRVTLVTRYDFQYNTIRSEPDPVSGLGETETSQTTGHIFAQNVSWTPWSRLFLQVGFNYVLNETVTPASDYTQAILDAQNNYWTLNFSSGFALTDKTDLHAGYFFYRADNYEDNSTVGVPYGAGATEHGITAGITHRLRENIRLNLRYGFARYQDEASAGNLDYDSHLVYGSVQYRF